MIQTEMVITFIDKKLDFACKNYNFQPYNLGLKYWDIFMECQGLLEPSVGSQDVLKIIKCAIHISLILVPGALFAILKDALPKLGLGTLAVGS